MGPNGVGKSTIFNLITGLKDPNYGEIFIDGTKSTKLPINERFTKFKLGFVYPSLKIFLPIRPKPKSAILIFLFNKGSSKVLKLRI